MIKLNNVPVLERGIECLRKQGITELIITVSHLGDVIMDYFGDGSRISPVTGEPFGVNIEYYVEEAPLGNAGALFKIKEKLDSDFLLLNADLIFDVDFERMMHFHKAKNAVVTLFTHPNSHPYDSGLIMADKEGVVTQWLSKEDIRPKYYKNRVNAGLHILSPKIFDMVPIEEEKIGQVDSVTGIINKVDLDRQLLKYLAGRGVMYCYDSPEYVKDMGTPERFTQVEEEVRCGRVRERNLTNKQKAVFLDRDGTINRYIKFLRNIDQFELLDGVAEAIKTIHNKGYLCIVVTNQPVIARGEVTYAELEEIHNKMETLLGLEGTYIDAIYFCPHHPDKGYAGEVEELKIECDCRKPKPGMLLKAAEDFHIDLSASWMVGDSERDVLAGRAAGCRSVLIESDRAVKMVQGEDMVCSVEEFVQKYLRQL